MGDQHWTSSGIIRSRLGRRPRPPYGPPRPAEIVPARAAWPAISPGRIRSAGSVPAGARRAGIGAVAITPARIVAVALIAVFLLVTAPTAEPAAAASKPLTIAALGDSYSSGEGTPPFDQNPAGCRRSAAAWPKLLGQMSPPATVTLHAACSGATTRALHESHKKAPPQLVQLRNLATPPDVVTITIGGNDAKFSQVLLSCVAWKCFWDGDERRRKDFIEDELPDLLVASYEAVKAEAPKSRVVVVGYPNLFPTSKRDNVCRWLDDKERRQLNSLNRTLERVVRRAARDAGVEYVSTAQALRGHEMCTKDPWVHPVSVFGQQRDFSGHPNRAGQEAIARAVHEYLFDDRR